MFSAFLLAALDLDVLYLGVAILNLSIMQIFNLTVLNSTKREIHGQLTPFGEYKP